MSNSSRLRRGCESGSIDRRAALGGAPIDAALRSLLAWVACLLAPAWLVAAEVLPGEEAPHAPGGAPVVAEPARRGPLAFRAWFDPAVRDAPASGRLVVYVLPAPFIGRDPGRGIGVGPTRPVFAVDVSDMRPGQAVVIDDSADAFPSPPSKLPPGRYLARVVLDLQRISGDWHREPGNLTGEPVEFTIRPNGDGPGTLEVRLDYPVQPRPERNFAGVEFFETSSPLLSAFSGREVKLRAALILPDNYRADRKYAAIYDVPGFGGTHREAYQFARGREAYATANPAARELNGEAFEIFLNPDSPYGHTLFCDSEVNGPWGRALVEELIPALEAKYPLLARPEARLLRGHSSGGWSTLWLATEYPHVFGATWSSSPDPVDFRRFQRVDLYAQDNFFRLTNPDGTPDHAIPSCISGGRAVSTIEDEVRVDEVIGPGRTSGQQWAAWQSCWGRRGPDGNARPLFDVDTGAINREEAETYRRFDIVDRLRRDPERFLPIFRDRVRVIVGDRDDWDLHLAVGLLRDELARLCGSENTPGGAGYIKIVRGHDHSSIFDAPELRSVPGEMLEHLRLHGLIGEAPPAGERPRAP